MAAYNAGGSLTWAAVLNASQFNSGIQSMVAQMAYAQRASAGLQASLAGIATVTFAAVVGGIAGITAAIYVATKAAADWETQMMSIARVSIDNFDYSTPQGKEQFRQLSRANQEIYMNVPLKNGTESLIKAQEPFALAGFTGKALTDLTEQLLKFSTVINYAVSEENIANAIVKSAQINRGEVEALGGGDYQKGVVEYSKKYLDTVLALSNKYTISPADLIKASTDAAGSATISGNLNNTDRQLAMYTLLNQYGVRPDIMRTMMTSSFSTAGLAGESTARIETALNRIGVATEQTVKGATGKDKTEKIKYSRAQIAGYLLGVSEDRFRSMIETDAYGTQIQLIDAIEKLDVDRLSKNALGAGLFGSYAGRETSKLAGGDALSVYEEINKLASSAWESGGQVQSQYENSLLELNKQWGLMGQRAYTIKDLLGEIVIDPVKSGVKYFSEGLQGAAQWLTKIVDGSRNLDGTVNTWEAIGKVIDGIKSKIPKDAFKIAVSLVGAALVISNLNTIKTAAGVAVGALLKMSGITLSPLLGPITTLVGALGTIGIAAVAVAVGLGAIGYALNPEKFTYFNQLATEAINGVSVVVKQLYTDLSTGDWSAAATHLKDAFMATIAWLQGIDWGRLGSEIVTMIGDGVKAVIGTALNLAGLLYDSLRNWVNSGAPYKLGQDIADFIGDGLKSVSKIDWWETLKSAFGTISNWLGLGYDIIVSIGNGVMSKVSDAFNPAANKIVEVLAKAAYDIWAIFGKTWNTLIYAATIAAIGIGDAFSGVGEKIAGFLKPAIDAASNLASTVSNIKLPSLGNVVNAAGNIINPIIGYYNPDSGARMSVEEYNKRASSKSKSIKGYEPVRMYGGNSEFISMSSTSGSEIISGTIGNVKSSLSTPATFTNTIEGPFGIEIKTKPSEKVTGPYDVEGGLQVIARTLGKFFTGYRTGGKGFVIDELVAANDKETYLKTDRGDYMTWFKDAKMDTDVLKDTLQYYIDFPADTSAMAKEYANMMVPLKETLKTSSEEASRITTSGATSSANILKDGISQSTTSWKNASDYSSKNTMSITDFVNSTTRSTAVETSSMTKKAVAESYSPVKIGLIESGQQIAIIGKVAQQQFEQSGNKWMNDTGSAGVTFNSDTTSGGKSIRNDIGIAGDELISKVAGLQLGGSGGSGGAEKTRTNTSYEDPIIKELGSTVSSIIGGSFKRLTMNKTSIFGGSDQLLKNVEDITCDGARVMINTGIYTSPTGEKSAFNPMDNEETRLLSNKVEGTFQDMTCIGTTVNIPGLKYTNPYGVTSYINPNEYIGGGGVLDYQQAATTTTQAAIDSAKITTSAAKQSSEYQKGADNYHAQLILGVGGLMDQQAKENMRLEKMNRIESGNVWLNGVGMSKDAWGLGVEQTIFDETEASNEQIKQARDYLGTEATVHSEIYNNLKNAAIEQHSVNTELIGTAESLTALNSSIAASAINFQSAFQGMISGMYSYSSGGGAWGGTSANGMGGWIGTNSDAYHGSTVTGIGAFISDYVRQNGSGSLKGYSFSWGAKGSLIEEPTRLIAGEKGRELLLPNNLTELFIKLAALGFNNVNSNGGSGDTVVIVNIDGEQVEKIVSRRQKRNLNLKGLKLH